MSVILSNPNLNSVTFITDLARATYGTKVLAKSTLGNRKTPKKTSKGSEIPSEAKISQNQKQLEVPREKISNDEEEAEDVGSGAIPENDGDKKQPLDPNILAAIFGWSSFHKSIRNLY
jgi:hypothetical protein